MPNGRTDRQSDSLSSCRSLKVFLAKSFLAGIENGEYFGLSSSDYHSDLSDHSPRGRSLTRPDLASVSRHDRLSVDRERRDTRQQDMTRHQSVDRPGIVMGCENYP